MTWVETPGGVSWRLPSMILLIFLLNQLSDLSIAGGGCNGDYCVEWEILTKQNFSSQIILHSHILLMVTVPWSGESKSLMREIAYAVSCKEDSFGSLRLMLLHKNSEKMLAEAIDATNEITILYYRNSVSYKYHGRLEARNILFSAYHLISLSPEELPLKSVGTQEDLEKLLESTDKAMLLLEFCGWTTKLLSKTNSGIESALDVTGGLFGTIFSGETNLTLGHRENKCQEGILDGALNYGVKNQANPNLLLDFGLLNKTPDGVSCTLEEFQHFNSFLQKFLNTAREFFLPAERQKFALVSDRSLLSSLGIEESGSWLAFLYHTGCPNCSMILKDGDNLKDALQLHRSLVTELEGDGVDLKAALPAKKPSMLLFVDRSSESPKIRQKSGEALDAFRKFVLQNQIITQDNTSLGAFQVSMNEPGHSQLATSSQTRDSKMSITIVNEGGHIALDSIASDLRGSSLQEALAYVLQQQKEAKLSSVAKQAGFQLLSDDFNINIADMLSQTDGAQSKQELRELSLGNKRLSSEESVSSLKDKEHLQHIDADHSSLHDEGKPNPLDKSVGEIPLEADHHSANDELAIAENVEVEGESLLQVDKLSKQQPLLQAFKGSFFFSDGGYQLLEALTSAIKIPSLVIVDPLSQQHYVFPERTIFNDSSLVDFVEGFLNHTLSPYQQSESFIASPREGIHPPFVNLDFHAVNGIPRVTAITFSKMVLGLNECGNGKVDHVWKKDVLVFFSNSWCGFCQRMELVVREVYRALKGFVIMQKGAPGKGDCSFENDCLEEITFKLPLIYLMDCTLNDCSLILKSIGQRELYPSLLLFPAEKKNAVAYEGDMAVTSIMKFIADHGSNSDLITRILMTWAKKSGRSQGSYEKPSHEFTLKRRTPAESAVEYKITPPYTSPHVKVGSILFATDKLLGMQLFEKSKILIVRAERHTGFQGLIINKRIGWESLNGLVKGFEMLKDAPLSLGGPLILRGLVLLSLSRECVDGQHPEVLPGVYFLDQSATSIEIKRFKSGNRSFMNHWFFVGYSSWGRSQLLDEISDGAWDIGNEDAMGQLEWP